MSDPVNPEGPARRNVDENIVRKRSTDPRLRVGALGADGAGSTPPLPLPPQPLIVDVSPPPAFLGLPGQAVPATHDFDAPTVAQALPELPTVQAVRPAGPPLPPAALPPVSAAPPPPASLRVDTAFVGFEGGPATSVDVAPAMPARPRGSTLPGAVLDDVDTGSARRPVRERVRSASGPIEIPGGQHRDPDGEHSSSGRVRPSTNVAALDPPVEGSSSGRVRPNVAALDPPVEASSSGRVRPNVAALDPPVEASSSGRVRPVTAVSALDPPVEASSSGRVRPPADGPVETSGTRQRPAGASEPAGSRGPLVAGAVIAILVVVALGLGRDGAGTSHRYSAADERRLTDLWLAHGTAPWGGVRDDGVVRAVEQVGATVAKSLTGSPGSPRFVVLKDEVAVQSFALPDGTIVVTTAALRRLGNEAQLAALLAHGLAHVARGDVAAVLDRRVDVEPAVRQALGGGDPKAAVELVTTAATVPQTPVQELEADRLALDALADAGFAPTALSDVIRNFGVRGGGRRAAWLGLHPDDPARLALVKEAGGGGRTNETEYANRVLDVIGRHTAVAVPTDDATPTPTAPNAPKRGLRTLPTTAPTTTPAPTTTTTTTTTPPTPAP